jgi:hypothetical protein
MPLDTFYLPKESISFGNFPVLRDVQTDLESIMTFALRVNSALIDYNEAKYDKIDVNMDEVGRNIDLCRATCSTLGLADKVPYDILLEVRSIQTQLQSIRVMYRTMGKDVIGVPNKASEGSGV